MLLHTLKFSCHLTEKILFKLKTKFIEMRKSYKLLQQNGFIKKAFSKTKFCFFNFSNELLFAFASLLGPPVCVCGVMCDMHRIG